MWGLRAAGPGEAGRGGGQAAVPGRVPQGDITAGTVGSVWRREKGRCQPPARGAGGEGDEEQQRSPMGPEGAGTAESDVGNTQPSTEPKSRPQSPEHRRVPSTMDPHTHTADPRPPASQHPAPPAPKAAAETEAPESQTPAQSPTAGRARWLGQPGRACPLSLSPPGSRVPAGGVLLPPPPPPNTYSKTTAPASGLFLV